MGLVAGRARGLAHALRSPQGFTPAGGHVINTNCSAVHTRQALCCKMSVEYDKFIESGRKYVAATPLHPPTEPRAAAGPTHLGRPRLRDVPTAPRWFCHVDDDNYVNPGGLLQLLSAFSPSQDVYLGRPSLDHPIEATERAQGGGTVSAGPGQGQLGAWRPCGEGVGVGGALTGGSLPHQVTTVKFWFATGGAGFCLSRGLALKMSPWAR